MCWLENISAPEDLVTHKNRKKVAGKKTKNKKDVMRHVHVQVIFTKCTPGLRNVFLPGNWWQRTRKTQGGKRVVKYLIGDNLIHLLVLETRSPERRRSKRCFCHLLFVSLRVILIPRGRLSVERLHENIPSDPGHYRPIQQQRSLLTCVSPRPNLLGPRLSLTQRSC